jgi:WD40 repeat protein
MSTAAANAITILVGAGENFVDADLQGIRIPGADISYGVFDSAKLQGADLKKVNLRGAWLSQADLSGAEMEGAEFSEQPFLTENTRVCSCAFSPDGESFAIGLETGGIALYTTSNWEISGRFPAHEDKVQSIVYTSKGDQFASVSRGRLIVWNVRTGTPRTIAKRLMGCNIAFSPQGDYIVCNYYDTTVPILHAKTGDSYRILKGHTGRVTSVAYSPKDNQVASGSKDTTIRIWNVETRDCIHILKTDHKVLAIAYSPAGDLIASGGDDKAIQLWDLDTGDRRHVLKGHIDSISSVVFSFEGGQIASGDKSGRVRLWDARIGASLCTLSGHDREVSSVAYSPRGGLVTCSKDKNVRLWNVSAKTSNSTGVYSVQCSPKGDQFTSGGSDCTIRLWDAETGSCQLIMRGHQGMVVSVAYSPDGTRLVSGSEDNSVRLWDVKTGGCIQSFSGHNSKVNCVAYSPHGDTVVSGSSDTTLRLWYLSSGDYLKLTGHTRDVLSVAYSPYNDQIASGSMDSTVRLWNVRTGKCDRELIGHSGGVRSVVYSPTGTQLASASDDMTARLWDVDTGTCTWTSTGHFGEVVCVAFSPNGERLGSGSLDRTVQIWNVATGQSISVIDSFQEPVRSIAWNTVPETQLPHRNYLVTGCGNGSMLMWEVTELQEMCRVRPRWSVNGALNVKGAIVQDVLGLTPLNKQLLKQREAVGEPAHSLLRRS